MNKLNEMKKDFNKGLPKVWNRFDNKTDEHTKITEKFFDISVEGLEKVCINH